MGNGVEGLRLWRNQNARKGQRLAYFHIVKKVETYGDFLEFQAASNEEVEALAAVLPPALPSAPSCSSSSSAGASTGATDLFIVMALPRRSRSSPKVDPGKLTPVSLGRSTQGPNRMERAPAHRARSHQP